MSTKILAYGTKEDMWNLERDLHKKYDVAKILNTSTLLKVGVLTKQSELMI